MDNNKKLDPLDELIQKHKDVYPDLAPTTPKNDSQDEITLKPEDHPTVKPHVDSEPASVVTNQQQEESTIDDDDEDAFEDVDIEDDEEVVDEDVDYGDSDLEEEIRQEELAEEQARQQMIDERQANEKKPMQMPPNSLDPKFQANAVDFQANKLAIVSEMIKQVLAKHNITSGGIPDDIRMQVMGELVDMYHYTGETITPEFEKMILDHWVTNGDQIESDETPENTEEQPKETTPENPTININVEKGTPVTVNVDESITSQLSYAHELNIRVKEVSEKELLAASVIENSNQPGIITPYDSGLHDVPITLPFSGYRCVMRSINYFDFIRLQAPTSDNPVDNELKRWTIIYEHMKNISIGPFADFDDFLKKTKYVDKEILMWALLTATSNEEEEIYVSCINDDCDQKGIPVKYNPRSIVHINEKDVPESCEKTRTVPAGPEAVAHFDEINGKHIEYVLPDTKVVIELGEASAYDFIMNKLPLTQELYNRYRPDEKLVEIDIDNVNMLEYNYLLSNAMYITAATIVTEENGEIKRYRYTDWPHIEEIVTKGLNDKDSATLMRLIEHERTGKQPFQFYIEKTVECPKCKTKIKKINIANIGETLLLQISRKLQSTTINLTI